MNGTIKADFAVFMMDAVRCLGLAAQFVSGYLHDEELVDAGGGVVGGRNLIRVAVAREAAQAAPLVGSFTGTASDFLSLTVDVEVTAE